MRISAILHTRLEPLTIIHTPLGERWSSLRQYVHLPSGRCLDRAFSRAKGHRLLQSCSQRLTAIYAPTVSSVLRSRAASLSAYRRHRAPRSPMASFAGGQVRLVSPDHLRQAVLSDGLRIPTRTLAVRNAVTSNSFVKKSPLCSALGAYSTSI